jgi:hypothetical protein
MKTLCGNWRPRLVLPAQPRSKMRIAGEKGVEVYAKA